MWLVTGYREARAALADPRLSNDLQRTARFFGGGARHSRSPRVAGGGPRSPGWRRPRGLREDNAVLGKANRTGIQALVDRGLATLAFEVPGTGDCPAAPSDPASADRLLSSILDWTVDSASEFGLDPATILVWGVSTGGYYATRAAHTHADRLFAVVAHGGGCHHMFDADWIGAQNQMEFPFALADALAHKFGYRDPDPAAALAAYAADAHRFSLVDSGVLATPACRLLVINGAEDSIFPIEDTILAGTRGSATGLIVRGGRAHMGNPAAERDIFAWLDEALATLP